MIDGAPEVVPLAVDLHENLVEMTPPVARSQPLDPALLDLICEHRAEPMLPKPHRLVADVDTTLVEQILDIPERQWEPHIEHHCEADDLGARFEVLEGGAIGHARTLSAALPRLKRCYSDRTPARDLFSGLQCASGGGGGIFRLAYISH